jgi:general secretion pathway protein N
MLLPSIKHCSPVIALLATALGATAATHALPTDDSDLYASRGTDLQSMSTVSDPPAKPEQIVVVQPPEAQPAAPARALSPNPLWEIPLSNLSSTRERPIFSPSRRPPPVLIAAPPTPPAPPPPPKSPRVERPQLSLVGTVSGDDEQFGIFVDQTSKAALRLRIGEDYQGWKLRTVQGREVTLQYEQQTAILTLPEPGTTLGQPSLRPWADNAAAQNQAAMPPRRDKHR